jgi:phage gp46-like protein
LRIPAYIRLKVKRATWLYAPNRQYGSDYHTIVKRPASNSNTRLENIGAVALQPILNDGRAKEVDLTVTQNGRYGTELKTTIVDASGEVETNVFQGLL